MCTVSWLHAGSGYHLFFNRDEKKTRAVATPPRFSIEDGIGILAPRDPQGGGTWIAVNSCGVSLSLLNGVGPVPSMAMSRGLLPDRLIRLGSLAAILASLRNTDLAMFLPFRLVILAPGHPIHLFEWDGMDRRLVTSDADSGFVTSSSYEPQRVAESRRGVFDAMKPVVADSLEGFHRYHGESPNALSPCMHRDDAETVSFTRIRVDETSASLFYVDGAPCRQGPSMLLEIPRC